MATSRCSNYDINRIYTKFNHFEKVVDLSSKCLLSTLFFHLYMFPPDMKAVSQTLLGRSRISLLPHTVTTYNSCINLHAKCHTASQYV